MVVRMKKKPGKQASDSGLSRSVAVYQTLRTEILNDRRPGEPLSSVRVLRERFGVSINTICAALDILANDGLVEKRHGSGVYMTPRNSPLRIGILSELNLLDYRMGPYFRMIADKIRCLAAADGAVATLYMGHAELGEASPSDEPTCPQFWVDTAEHRLDGAIILNVPSTQSWDQRIRHSAVPATGCFTSYRTSLDFPAMARTGVRHLATVGCRRFALLGGGCGEAFQAAVAEHGGSTCDAWVAADIKSGRVGAAFGAVVRFWSVSAEKPDGLVILDDTYLAEAQLHLLQCNVDVPGSLKLAVLAESGAFPACPFPFTALTIDSSEAANFLVNSLFVLMRGGSLEPCQKNLPFHLEPVAGLKADF